MKRIIQFAINQPLFIMLSGLLFVMAGVYSFNTLSVEAFPDVTDTQVTIITLYPGRAAEEVERQVTIPLEVVLSGIPNAIRVFSHTQFGLSFIVVTFNDIPSGYFTRQLVVERLREAGLVYPCFCTRAEIRAAASAPHTRAAKSGWRMRSFMQAGWRAQRRPRVAAAGQA